MSETEINNLYVLTYLIHRETLCGWLVLLISEFTNLKNKTKKKSTGHYVTHPKLQTNKCQN